MLSINIIISNSSVNYTFFVSFKLNNFEVNCTNHATEILRGGSAIICENSINHELLSEYQTYHIQATTISISDKSGSITVSALYSYAKKRRT